MTYKNQGGSAFPVPAISQNSGTGETTVHQSDGGMTLRDWFATHAPAVPDDFEWEDGETDLYQRLVRWNWHYADMMIKAREA